MKHKKFYSIGKFLNKFHFFNLISQNFIKKSTKRKTTYDYWIWQKFRIIPEEIFTTAFIFLISAAIIALIIYLLNKNSLFCVMILLIAYCGYYFFLNAPYDEVKKDKLFFELYFERLILDYSLLLDISNKEDDTFFNILENIEKTLKSKDYEGRGLIRLIYGGIIPEKVFPKNFSPSRKLNDFLENINLYRNSSQLDLADYSQEMKMNAGTSTLETKLSFYFFFSLFIPFGISLISMVQLLDFMWFLIILIIYPLLSYKIREIVVFSTMKIFGLGEEDSKELREFNLILEQLSRYLDIYPPEYCILLILKNQRIQVNLSQTQNLGLTPLFLSLSNNFRSKKIHLIIDHLQKLIKQDSASARDKINRIKNRLSIQRNIQKQRIQQIKAHRIKVICFILILPMILGILSSLYPIFSNSALFGVELQDMHVLNGLGIGTTNLVQFPLYYCGLMVFTITSGMNFSKLLLEKRSVKIVVLSCLIFVISFWIGDIFLKINLI